jgi:hypothetical protein
MIVIEQKVTREVTEKLELENPTFYKLKYGGHWGIYSADKIVTVYATPGISDYATVAIGTYKHLSCTSPVFESEITEEEFNDIVSKALEMISANQLQPA